MKKSSSMHIKVLATLVIAPVIVIVACNKTLNREPKSAFDEQYVFSSTISATSAVLGVYNALTGDNGYGSRLNLYYTVDNDCILGPPNTASGGGDNDRSSIARYNTASGNQQLEAPFNKLYTGIERANVCIKNIPAMDLYTNGSATDQAALKRLYGEALTLRAQFYFEAVRNWGDLPAPFVPSADQTDLFLEKTDRDTIYDHILADLKIAEDLVPWRTEVARDERITKGAVKGLRARIALFRGGYSLRRATHQMERRSDYLTYYTIARDECSDLLARRDEHTLNTSFRSVFKDNLDAHVIDPSGEVMFEVALAGGTSSTDGKMGYYDGNKVNGKGNRFRYIVPTYFYAFDSLDTRRDVTCAPYDVASNGYKTGLTIYNVSPGKYRREWISNPLIDPTSSEQYFGVNWPILRFSDVLLMFAEADNELNSGPTPAAVSAYEEVRKRAFGSAAIGITPADKEGFFNAVVNERALEFGEEGIRKYDLIRWNLINQKLIDTRANLTKMINKQAPYDNLPQTMYYKINSSGDYTFYNSLYNPSPTTAPSTSTWKSVAWVSSITPAFINAVAELFKPNHSELLPLPLTIINSNPKISQDCGCNN
jgi:hypothetical protein